MNLAGFAKSIGGEFVAGCLIATVDGKRQYLHRDGEFTFKGRELYLAWERTPTAELDEAIASAETPVRRKSHKYMRNSHG
jgi:hypothetical protein